VETHLKLSQLQAELKTHNARLEETVRARTRELAEARDRLAILDKAKSDFLTLISHELRTPLAGLFGITDLVFLECESNPTSPNCGSRSRSRGKDSSPSSTMPCCFAKSKRRATNSPRSPSRCTPCWPRRSRRPALLPGATCPSARCRDGTGLIVGKEDLLIKAFQALLETAVKFCEKAGPRCDCRAVRCSNGNPVWRSRPPDERFRRKRSPVSSMYWPSASPSLPAATWGSGHPWLSVLFRCLADRWPSRISIPRYSPGIGLKTAAATINVPAAACGRGCRQACRGGR
jgi:hypothetical protein